jgi:hypothetical protein
LNKINYLIFNNKQLTKSTTTIYSTKFTISNSTTIYSTKFPTPIQNNLQLQQNITNNEKEIFDKNTNCFNNSSIKNKKSNNIINYPSFNDI